MALDREAAWRAWTSFRGTGPAVRAFLLARLAVAQLGPLGEAVRPLSGRVLSLGCGYGVVDRYLAEVNPALEIVGVELDPARVAVAAASADRAPRVSVREADVTRLEERSSFDLALAIDVFHHLPAGEHRRMAGVLFELLRPGGELLLKDIADTPRWKYLFNRLHDRIVAGPEATHCRAPEDMAALVADAGFAVQATERLGRLGPYPHYLVRATRPARSASGDAPPEP